jgi:hypothetical protein
LASAGQTRYSQELKTSWGHPLEAKYGQAVNAETNETWFNLVEKTFTNYHVKAHNTYAVDELGC